MEYREIEAFSKTYIKEIIFLRYLKIIHWLIHFVYFYLLLETLKLIIYWFKYWVKYLPNRLIYEKTNNKRSHKKLPILFFHEVSLIFKEFVTWIVIGTLLKGFGSFCIKVNWNIFDLNSNVWMMGSDHGTLLNLNERSILASQISQ